MTARPPRLTLGQAFALGTTVVAVLAAAVLLVFLAGSQRAILEGASHVRERAARDVIAQVATELGEADDARRSVFIALRARVATAAEPLSLEPLLFTEILDHDHVAEISFTHAALSGWDDEGNAIVSPEGRWSLSVVRTTAEDDSPIVTRHVMRDGAAFVADVRARPKDGALDAAPFVRAPGEAADPVAALTFQTTVLRRLYGDAIWSDLHWFEPDQDKPEQGRRVTVSLQQAIVDDAGTFVGVLRVSIRAERIDEIAHLSVNEDDPGDPHRIFLCDDEGHLVTRLSPTDPLMIVDDLLRVSPPSVPPAIRAALASDVLRRANDTDDAANGMIDVGGETYVVSFYPIPRTQRWRVGIVVPEAYYTKDLRPLRDRSLVAFGAIFGLAIAGGSLGLRAIRRGLGQLLDRTTRMRRFDFAADAMRSPFKDVQEVMDGLERAKTVTRALGKYVPVDLVRRLFADNKDPALGGEMRTLTMMFTDIKDFTTLSERLAPDVLARALGKYLQAMTEAIEESGGTIDKFIGDAVMALWNAPEAREGHAVLACRAALACRERTAALYASPEWSELPPLVTRAGLHTAEVMVGHFGAPSRLSYTALGDGVNLASRLEGLCKQYGVTILASEAVVERAGEAFEFRLVDRVAVKGKTFAVRVYELLGEKGACDAKLPAARAYEAAYAAYERRAFDEARAILATLEGDGPSRTLDARCRALLAEPPPADWDGVLRSTSK